MPVERTMMENGRVFLLKISDPWTAEQIANVLSDDVDLLNRSHTEVHTLLDLSASRQLPKGILSLRSRPATFHKMTGHVVIVGASSVMKAIGGVFSQLTGNKRLVNVDTIEEAWTFLHEKMAEEDRIIEG